MEQHSTKRVMSMPPMKSLLLLLFLFFFGMLCHAAPDADAAKSFNFAIMPKDTVNSFFFPVREGCESRSAAIEDYKVTCEWVGPADEDPTGEAQVKVLREITAAHVNGTHLTHGIAISVTNGPSLVEPIQEALQAGISVICFDSDSVESERQAYVGTDNVAFGVQLGKVLEQLQPTGGELAILTKPSPNLGQRIAGLRQQIALSGVWQELPDSLTYQGGALNDTLAQIAQLKRDNSNLKAIVPTYGRPMRETQIWTSFVSEHRDMAFVVADAMPNQVRLMEQGFADGLVGQLPYQSGEQCIDTLLNLQLNGNPPRDRSNDMVFGTNLSFLLRIPLVLPDLEVDLNYLGPMRILGYVLLAIVGLSAVTLMAWVIRKRKTRVVAAGQPIFLLTILFGILIMATAILPLGAGDDNTNNQNALNAACMAVPWLVTIGFGIVFSALFSKLWRVQRLINSSMRFSKVQVRPQDVLWPLSVLTLINVILLISWTVVAPLEYSRQLHDGSDPWNRPISSYGVCSAASGTNALPFQICLILINFGALLVANIQAFRTRHMKSVLSESKYIAITVASMMQAFLVGLPVLLLVDEEPKAQYVVSVLLIFCICIAIIGLIFVPKVLAERSGNDRMDARHSNLGTSIRESIRGSMAFQRNTSVSMDQNSSIVVNDTVAQIRQAAMECSKASEFPATFDDPERALPNSNNGSEEPRPAEEEKDDKSK